MYGRPHPKPAVSAVIIQDGKVLLTLRSDTVLFAKQWCVPGGHLAGGQKWIDGLKAEVSEEVGLEVVEQQLVGIYSDPKLNQIKDEKSGETHTFVVASFLVKKFTGDIRINDEVVEYGWFSLNDLPKPMVISETIKIQDAFAFQGKCFLR